MTPSQPAGHYIDLTTRDGGAVRTFVAPPRAAPRAVVIVLQHMDQRKPGSSHKDRAPAGPGGARPGVAPHARHQCEAFASQGYLALAPSTFGRGVSGLDYGYRIQENYWGSRLAAPLSALPSPAVMFDIESAMLHAARVAPNLRIGIVGVCWGGLLAWRAAAQFKSLDACVCNYPGGIDGDDDRVLQPRCPTLVQFASDKRWMPRERMDAFMQAQAAADGAQATAAAREVQVYEAGYGFMQKQHRAYDEAASNTAMRRTLDFLSAHLGGALPSA